MDSDSLEVQLKAHKTALQRQSEQLLQHIQEHVREQAEIEKRIAAADVLLSEFDVGPAAMEPLLIADETPAKPGAKPNLTGMTVVQACATVLSQQNRPMKVAELTRAIYDGGIRLKSQTPDRSVAVLLQRNRRFMRVAPGTFALVRAHDPTHQPTRQRSGRLNAEGAIKGTERILKESGKPMHVRDIFVALEATGFRSNAKRPQAMLSGTLKRSPRFRLVGGDRWALAESAEKKVAATS